MTYFTLNLSAVAFQVVKPFLVERFGAAVFFSTEGVEAPRSWLRRRLPAPENLIFAIRLPQGLSSTVKVSGTALTTGD